MNVGEWVARDPGRELLVGPEADLDAMLEACLANEFVRDLFVVDDDRRVLGWISGRRLARLALGEYLPRQTSRALRERLGDTRAEQVMDTHFVAASEDEPIEQVIGSLLDGTQEDLPVLDEEGRLLGVVHLRALLARVHHGRRLASEPPPEPEAESDEEE